MPRGPISLALLGLYLLSHLRFTAVLAGISSSNTTTEVVDDDILVLRVPVRLHKGLLGPKVGVPPILSYKLRMVALFNDFALFDNDDQVGVHDGRKAMPVIKVSGKLAKWQFTYATTNVVRPSQSFLNDAWICCSVSVSTALVASSKSTTSGRFKIARAIAIRWSSPPESFLQRQPCCVTALLLRLTRRALRLVSRSLSGSAESNSSWQRWVLTVAKLQYLVVYTSCFARIVNLLVRRIDVSVADVAQDAVVKQNRVLRYDANPVSKAVEVSTGIWALWMHRT